MTTVVAYTWARDVASAHVRPDGSVDWRGAKPTPGQDDAAAVVVALAVAAGRDDEVVGLTLGNGDASWALARGVGRAVAVTDAVETDDDAASAAALAAAVRTVPGTDVVVIGDDEQHPGVPPTLAGLLGWPAVLGVASAEVVDGTVLAVRRDASGEQVLALVPPVLIGVAAEAAERRAPGMKEMLAARKRPVERTTLAALDVPVPAVVEVRQTRVPQTAGARLFTGTPDGVARDLVAALRSEGVA